MGSARCCCPGPDPDVPCRINDYCRYYLENVDDWSPVVDSIGEPYNFYRSITQGDTQPLRRPFLPNTVSIKADIDLTDPLLNMDVVFLVIAAESGRCGPDADGFLQIGIGNIFQTELNTQAIEAVVVGGTNIREERDIAYVAGATLELLATRSSGNDYVLDFKYNGDVIYTVTVPVFWFDPMWHLCAHVPNLVTTITNYTVEITPCIACVGQAYTSPGRREFWYPDGSANGQAQAGSGAGNLTGHGGITEVAGGISGNQWECDGSDTGRLSADFTDLLGNLGSSFGGGLLVDFAHDFTFSMWYEYDIVLGGLEINAQFGSIGANPSNVDSFQQDWVRFHCRGNVLLQAAVEIGSDCGPGSSVLTWDHPEQDSADSKNLYVFAWIREQQRFKVWIGNNDTKTLADGLINWGSFLVPNNSNSQRMTIGVTGVFGSRGRIDQPAVWPRALSQSDVVKLWNGGAGIITPSL